MALGMVNPASKSAKDEAEWAARNGVADPRVSSRESLLASLGVSLIAFKHAMRPEMHARAVNDLRDCLRWRSPLGRPQRTRIAEAAIREWVVDICQSCFAARAEITGPTVIFDSMGFARPCMTCGGVGKRRYNDEERAQVGANNRHMETAHGLISFAVAYCIRQAQNKLKEPLDHGTNG
jgi:hypothetical protein